MEYDSKATSPVFLIAEELLAITNLVAKEADMTEGMASAIVAFTDAIYWKIMFAWARVADRIGL